VSGPTEHVDAVVVGGTIRGLVSAYVLGSLGYHTVLVHGAPTLGGADGSFVTSKGNVFDNGFHVLDEGRSPLTTRLFVHALGGHVRRMTLRRSIVLRGHVLDYAAAPRELPEELRSMLPGDELVDDIGDDTPTRADLARCYGADFADLILDEVLASYPTEVRHRAFGVDESLLLTNIYPWFFPRADRASPGADESRVFHDQLRSGRPQTILYPAEGGFGRFARSLADLCDPNLVEVVTAATDLDVKVEPGTSRVDHVEAAGRRFDADRYFWGGGWAPYCRTLGIACQDVITDRVVVGSFRLDRPANADGHEILVGDPRFHINRVQFPSALRGSDDALMQVEFAVPVHDDSWTLDSAEWRTRWWDDLTQLGLLDAGHRALDFEFRSFEMHFNGFGAEGEPLRDADPTSVPADTNLLALAPSMANLNLNRYVPQVVADVVAAVSETGS
jgi:glycine/D-amino acid oxidase-like deaminating enzyme